MVAGRTLVTTPVTSHLDRLIFFFRHSVFTLFAYN